jgi:hypothetical protein
VELDRREVLKLLAVSVVAATGDTLLGCAHAGGAPHQGSPVEGRTPMNTRPLLTLKLTTSAVEAIGAVALGTRAVFPITGGTFEGPRLRGKVLPGGGDWTLLRSDGVLELDLRLTLATDDGALIHMTSFGLRHGPPEVLAALSRGERVDPAAYYFRTTPRFEAAAPQYAFLNRLVAVATADRRAEGPIYTIFEVL